jgi:hypothetical protein
LKKEYCLIQAREEEVRIIFSIFLGYNQSGCI